MRFKQFTDFLLPRTACLAVLLYGTGLRAQTPLPPPLMVQVPIVSAYVGVPTSTYNGSVASVSCSSATVGYLAANDGCPAAQTTLFYPYGVAIDSNDNIVTASVSGAGLSIVYRGGAAFASAIIAAKPTLISSSASGPMVGHVYQLAGGSSSGLTLLSGGGYSCSNKSAGARALDAYADGCPAQYAGVASRGVSVDAYGNIFFTQTSSSQYMGMKVLYVGGSAVANMISAYFTANCSNWPVSGNTTTPTTLVYSNVCAQTFTPTPGYIYTLARPYDFISIRGVSVYTNPATGGDTLYASDNGANTPVTGVQASTAGNQVKVFTGTGWTTLLASAASGSSTTVNGDGHAASAASVSGPSQLFTDQYGNLFIADISDARIRVVYNGGSTPPLYVEGSNSTVVTSPKVGYVYSVAGGGTLRTSPSLASALSTGGLYGFGIDAQGNLYLYDSSKLLWMENAISGVAVNIGGTAASTTYGTVSSSPGSGISCNAATGGPAMSDAYGDGCPATEIEPIGLSGALAFDSSGNFYAAEQRVTSAATAIVRRYSYQNSFGTVTAGSTSTSAVSFTPYTRTTTYTPTLKLNASGTASNDFVDAGNDICSTITGATSLVSIQTCAYSVSFTPSLAGSRFGSLTLTSGTSVLANVPLAGIGSGAQISLDPATQSTIGSVYSPGGIGVDQGGNIYLSDLMSGSIYRSAGGAAPALYATGFNQPGEIAVTGTGKVLVADMGNNRIAVVGSGAATPFVTTANSLALNQPAGVAVDPEGDVYIADTGNNRILELPYDGGLYGLTKVLPLSGLTAPMGLAVDAAGNLFVANSGAGNVVEWSSSGVQSTVSGLASVVKPVAVGVDPAGDLMIADAASQAVVTLPSGGGGTTRLIGNLSGLNGLTVDLVGNVYLAASGSKGATVLNRNRPTISYAQTNIGNSTSQAVGITNSGNLPLTIGPILESSTDAGDFNFTSASTNGCGTPSTVAIGVNCGILTIFQPQSVGALTDTVTFPSTNAVNGAALTLQGPAQLGLSYAFGNAGTSPNTINVTFTATLSSTTPSTPILGGVVFLINGVSTTVPVTGGAAVLMVQLAAGVYPVVATYTGASYPGFSVTATQNVTVVTGTSSIQLSVHSPSGAITYGQTVSLQALIANGNSPAVPTGTVTFTVNNLPAGTVPYASSVSLALPNPSFPILNAGVYSVVATYSGDGNFVPTSGTLTFTVGKATPTLSLAVLPVLGSPSNLISLSASVVAAPAYPTGNIVFTSGTTNIGSAALSVNGAAQISTTTNVLSSFSFTASYVVGTTEVNFLPASVTVTVPPQLVVVPSQTSITMLQKSVATIGLSLNSFFNYQSSSLTISCQGLPQFTVCDPIPVTGSISPNQVAQVSLQIFTDVPPASLQAQSQTRKKFAGAAVALLVLLFLPRKRTLRAYFLSVSLSVLCCTALIGCVSDTAVTTQHVTPAGTYSLEVIVSDGTSTYSAPVTLTVNSGLLSSNF